MFSSTTKLRNKDRHFLGPSCYWSVCPCAGLDMLHNGHATRHDCPGAVLLIPNSWPWYYLIIMQSKVSEITSGQGTRSGLSSQLHHCDCRCLFLFLTSPRSMSIPISLLFHRECQSSSLSSDDTWQTISPAPTPIFYLHGVSRWRGT
jgi:hypothetical protein